MYIKSVKLKNFRNYEKESITLGKNTNIFYGDNAQGKTNLLEAILVFSCGRSHRRASDSDMIMHGSDFAVIEIDFSDDTRDYSGKMIISGKTKKFVTINDAPIEKISQISNYINTVMFSPEDLCIIKEGPSERRRFIDMAISQLKPNYVAVLNDYYKALKQRNNILKNISKYDDEKAGDMLDIWDEQLGEKGSRILVYRNDFVNFINPYIKQFYNELSGEDSSICYECGVADITEDKDTFKDQIKEKLKKSRRRDIETRMTNCGVHRDDISFIINGKEAKIFASQGQQRSMILCLKLALTEAVKSIKGTYPIILLDDIMSELDKKRRSYFAEKIMDKQVLITTTDKRGSSSKYFFVKEGKITEE